MYVIDAREGVSADMLLAAMLGQLDERRRAEVIPKLRTAASVLEVTLRIDRVEDTGDRGLTAIYSRAESDMHSITSREAFNRLDAIGTSLSSSSDISRSMMEKILEAESVVHGVREEDVHLHEVGRPEALFNMGAIGYLSGCLEDFKPVESFFTRVTTGSGMVRTSHGTVDVPAPATSQLLMGLEHSPGDCRGERATPTGIAALKTLASGQVEELPERTLARSVGFGTRWWAGRRGRMVIVRV